MPNFGYTYCIHLEKLNYLNKFNYKNKIKCPHICYGDSDFCALKMEHQEVLDKDVQRGIYKS